MHRQLILFILLLVVQGCSFQNAKFQSALEQFLVKQPLFDSEYECPEPASLVISYEDTPESYVLHYDCSEERIAFVLLSPLGLSGGNISLSNDGQVSGETHGLLLKLSPVDLVYSALFPIRAAFKDDCDLGVLTKAPDDYCMVSYTFEKVSVKYTFLPSECERFCYEER